MKKVDLPPAPFPARTCAVVGRPEQADGANEWRPGGERRATACVGEEIHLEGGVEMLS